MRGGIWLVIFKSEHCRADWRPFARCGGRWVHSIWGLAAVFHPEPPSQNQHQSVFIIDLYSEAGQGWAFEAHHSGSQLELNCPVFPPSWSEGIGDLCLLLAPFPFSMMPLIPEPSWGSAEPHFLLQHPPPRPHI